jgi:hypothetical protein
MAIKPEDLREDLEAGRAGADADGASTRRAVATAGTAPISGNEREKLIKTISASYFLLRRGLAILALVFPIALWVGAGIDHLQPSISAYYHFQWIGGDRSPYGSGEMRDVFVGVLWAIGTFLFFYKGYSRKEDIALDLAGVAAVLIALFPQDWPSGMNSWVNQVHFTSAIVFFLAIAYVCLFRSNDTLRIITDEERRRWFKRLYALLGALMVVLPLGLFALHLLSDRLDVLPRRTDDSYIVLGLEVAAIWVFAAFWLVKSREIALIQKQLAMPGQQ